MSKKSTRQAYGEALVELGRINNDMEIIINECWLCEKDKKVNCKIKTKKCLTTVKKYDKILFVTRRR